MSTRSINPISSTPVINFKNSVSKPQSATDFSSVLNNAINKIDDSIKTSNTTLNHIMTGNGEDFHEFLIETEKATMSLQLTLQIRNKAIDAYNEIMRMQL